jgi:hypothetical protein
MKNNITGIFAAAVLFVASAFVSENASAAYRAENNDALFNSINVSDNIDVEIRQSETTGLIIDSSEPASELVKTEIKNGTLYIYSAENRSWGEKAKVIVMTPEIETIVMDGSGNVTCDGFIDSDYLKVILNGTGNITLDVNVLEVRVRIPGSGKICLSGSAAVEKISISGQGEVDAQGLKTFSAAVDISGQGNCRITSKDISVHISGTGNVLYSEAPSRLQVKVTGTGSVNEI